VVRNYLLRCLNCYSVILMHSQLQRVFYRGDASVVHWSPVSLLVPIRANCGRFRPRQYPITGTTTKKTHSTLTQPLHRPHAMHLPYQSSKEQRVTEVSPVVRNAATVKTHRTSFNCPGSFTCTSRRSVPKGFKEMFRCCWAALSLSLLEGCSTLQKIVTEN